MHRFHIPVMGTAFTIDTPMRVAKYGIALVISIVDDDLVERMRGYWSRRLGLAYRPIERDLAADSRARRITAYLNLVSEVVRAEFEALRKAPLRAGSELVRYLELLPEDAPLKRLYRRWQARRSPELEAEIRRRIVPGRVEANVMTKVDKQNYHRGKPLPVEMNDAHAAVRGFAESDLSGGLCLSAGMNPRLYSYLAKFKDFFADEAGRFKKEIILKVSDFRSALTQGKFLAKKGLWVSEFRLESGLNCGGHAFATPGLLMGPILEEFRRRRDELVETLFSLYQKALMRLGLPVPKEPPPLRLSAQGGVGNAFEQRLLTEHYGLDSVGWGSPFLLVPEVTTLDEKTRGDLARAGEGELELSGASPLGVPFHTLKGASMAERMRSWYAEGRPGSPCPKGHLEFNREYTERPICTASRAYQYRKIREIEETLEGEERERAIARVLEKQCLCVGLAEPAHLTFELGPQMHEPAGVSVCPGPNIAYFKDTYTLDAMVDHIYGRRELALDPDRPHVFVKELRLYGDYLEALAEGRFGGEREQDPAYRETYRENLRQGARYYLEHEDELGLGPWREEIAAYL